MNEADDPVLTLPDPLGLAVSVNVTVWLLLEKVKVPGAVPVCPLLQYTLLIGEFVASWVIDIAVCEPCVMPQLVRSHRVSVPVDPRELMADALNGWLKVTEMVSPFAALPAVLPVALVLVTDVTVMAGHATVTEPVWATVS